MLCIWKCPGDVWKTHGMGSGNLYGSQVKISAVMGMGHDSPTRHPQNESKNIISGPELSEL